MKKTVILSLSLLLAGAAFSQEITCKKGKCTVPEAYLKELQEKAARAEKLEAELQKTTQNYENQLKAARSAMSIKLHDFTDSASYAIGKDLFNNWSMQGLPIDVEVVGHSLIDCANNKNKFTAQTMNPLLQRFQQEFDRKQQEKDQQMRERMPKTIAEGEKFLANNKNNKSVFTTASGLQYKIIKKGNGRKPKADDVVRIHYTGTLIDGTKFDSSYDRGVPLELPLNQVIPGWTEGVQLMDVGSHYMLYIPYQLGYGEQPMGTIPPGSVLIFDVELLDIVTPK